MKTATLSALLAAKRAARPIVLATRLSDGEELVLEADALPDGVLGDAARAALASDVSAPVEVEGAQWFVHAYNPPVRLVIVGAVHIAQPLVAMAAALGWQVSVVDPRESYATPARFPGTRLVAEWPGEALAALAPDARTAVVTLTHDPKLDDPGLEAALRSPAFYVGALGSRKTHGARLERLAAAGFDEVALARVRGPVGLAIGAKAPAEIAVSILAEIVATLRGAAR